MGNSRQVARWHVVSPDGTRLGVFQSGEGPPLLLVHGALGDHTRWDLLRTHLEPDLTVFAMDRRGRGASTDATTYDLEREYEDVAAVVDAIAERTRQPVTAYRHSYGGLCLFGAAPLTDNLDRIVLYEGWPPPAPELFAPSDDLLQRVGRLLAEGEADAALEQICREVVGMSEDEIAAYRADPSWSGRVAAASTYSREEVAFAEATWSVEAAARIRIPTLILTGERETEWHVHVDQVVDALPDARRVVLAGQAHSADLMAPAAVAAALRAFLPGREEMRGADLSVVAAQEG